MLRFTEEVKIERFTPEIGECLASAAEWSMKMEVDVWVTAIDNGTHGKITFHGKSLAIDLDTAGNRREDTRSLYEWQVWRLPVGWEVIEETTHVHHEADHGRRPKKRIRNA